MPLPKPILYCSFCGKMASEVQVLIAGPTVFICDECVDVCVGIIAEETAKKSAQFLDSLIKGEG